MQRGQDRERGATNVSAGAIDEDTTKHGSKKKKKKTAPEVSPVPLDNAGAPESNPSGEKEAPAVSDEAKGGGGAEWFGWMGVAALVVVAAALAADVLHLPPNLCRSPTPSSSSLLS